MGIVFQNDGTDFVGITKVETNGTVTIGSDGLHNHSTFASWGTLGWYTDAVVVSPGYVGYMQIQNGIAFNQQWMVGAQKTASISISDGVHIWWNGSLFTGYNTSAGSPQVADINIDVGNLWVDFKFEILLVGEVGACQMFVRLSDIGNLGLTNFDPEYATWRQVGTATVSNSDYDGASLRLSAIAYTAGGENDTRFVIITDDGTLGGGGGSKKTANKITSLMMMEDSEYNFSKQEKSNLYLPNNKEGICHQHFNPQIMKPSQQVCQPQVRF
jgi:hypothetical protein